METMSIEERFWSKVVKTDGCWFWTAGVSGIGYGYFHIRVNKTNVTVGAHRVAYELTVGPIPEGKMLLHQCDNPLCVRPDHLRPGTCKDNTDDRAARNRTARGSRHGQAKLDEEQVREIRSLNEYSDYSQREIARMYGVSQSTVMGIVTRRVWNHI